MKDLVFITGNQNKADLLAKWLAMPVPHHKVDLDELQSLDPHVVTEHKVRQAYDLLKRPVLVEDVSVVFTAMGRLPGTLIKWFLEELGNERLCKLVDGLEHRQAVVSVTYALYDGKQIHYFEHSINGRISPEPRGDHGFGWNAIFIPNGTDKTYAEMDDNEIRPFNARAQAIEKLRTFLKTN